VSIRRKLAAYSAAVILAAGSAALVVPGQAMAHGSPQAPGSRTWLCYQDGITPQGNIVPKNPACAAAVAQSGDNSLYNWFAVLRSDAGGRTTGYIPDGSLCSGGNPNFTGYDLARNDWPVTHLTAGGSFEIKYNNWANHPGTFYAYVTRDSWSPTRPLAWSDLEATPFSQVTNPPALGGPGTIDGHYFWTANLPANKTGRHIIYMRWVRSDSQENFFSCSDVVFDGGHGEVTGIGQTGSSSGPPPSSPPPGNGACNVSIAITNSWSGGFQAEGTVRAAPSAINGWTVSWTNPAGQGVSQVWNGNLITNTGSVTQVRNASWNGSIPANGSTSFGFIGTTSGGAVVPSATCSSP
jgi:predicted carbohydrate-binding protein with CBM5 and CBM33 domain